MDKVCIFGIDGFTGRHLQQYIQDHGLNEQYEFFGYGRQVGRHPAITLTSLQASDRQALSDVLTDVRPNYIINLIGPAHSSDFDTAIMLNAAISQWIAEIAIDQKLPIKKILAIGSAAEYGEPLKLPVCESDPPSPLNDYGFAKTIQTKTMLNYFRSYQLPVNIARTFNIVGTGLPDFLSIGSFVKQINQANNGDVITVGDLNKKRDFLDIADVVDAYWKILIEAPPGEVINVCSGRSYKISELLDFLINQSGKDIKRQFDPHLSRAHDVADIFGHNEKLRTMTGWTETGDIFVTLKKMVRTGAV